jgi:type II secretory pathway component PulM
MAKVQFDANVWLKAVKSEINLVISTFREKGVKRFDKTLGIAAAFIAAAYWFIYMPPQAKIARLGREIEAAKAMATAGTQYRELRDGLASSYGSLPLLKDQQQWLSNAMIDCLRADNLTPESFRPVLETEGSGVIFQTSTVELSLRFNDVYTWLLRLESAKPLMHIGVLDVTKKTDNIGMNGVSCSVMTAIPKMRFE